MDSGKQDVKNKKRNVPLEMSPEEFRSIGYKLVDDVGEFMGSISERPVTTGDSPSKLRDLIGRSSLPERGENASRLLEKTANLLFEHSLFNGHPKFLGYITSSAAPIGVLAELLAAAVNPNVGGWILSPVATEIELQTVQWIAEMIGYHSNCGGLLVSGGNMANFVSFLTARHAKANWNLREKGMLCEEATKMRVYASSEVHTWIHKAADISGLGTDSIRWIPTNSRLQIDTKALRQQIDTDLENGEKPFLVIGTAGSVSTGAIDPLTGLADICKEYSLWFHVDGAYGAFAAVLPEAPKEFQGMKEADSVAVDPHKWLYSPLEAGCALVKNTRQLVEAFSYHPLYYKFDDVDGETTTSLVDFGPQNSRGFRALKVWLGLKQVGRSGYEEMIRDDILLSRKLFHLAEAHPELEAFTHNLSITTFRYRPSDLKINHEDIETYLNELNSELLTRLQQGGEAFVSNAVLDGKYLLRACIVNFRTGLKDIEELPEIICRIGREVHQEMASKR
jgi:glutamate/tyrosine decarboxylase-like PLP-dependent enzyme